MKRIEEDTPSNSFLTKNITSLTFVGLLLIPFFILITQSPEENGFEYNTVLSGPSWSDNGFGINISSKGVYYIGDKQRTTGEIAIIIEEKLKERAIVLGAMTVWVVPHEKTKMKDVARIVDYLNREFSDSIHVTITGSRS
jgi:hypothetical protein